MLLQTNSYFVPKEKRTEHARLIKRFRALMHKLGCDDFDVFEQAGPNWSTETGGRFVQIMRFRDAAHQKAIRDAEQSDPSAQDLVREFCELIDFAYQQQQGMASTAYYRSLYAAPGTTDRPSDAEQPPRLPMGEPIDEEVPPIDDRKRGVKHASPRNGEIDD